MTIDSDGPSRGGGKRGGPRRGGPGKPPGRGGKPAGGGGPKRHGSIRLRPIGGNQFELDHHPCVRETELDYQEGMDLWKAGDPEAARDALRYALAACRDNLYVHAALGRIALEEFRDPALARGHFGYAVELGRKAIPPGFSGILPPHRDANRPFYDAIDGLIQSLEALGRRGDAAELRAMEHRLSGRRPPGEGPPRKVDPTS